MADSRPRDPRPGIAIFGAGLVGLYIGGLLAKLADVTFIGRPSMLDALNNGLRLTNATGLDVLVPAAGFARATQPDALAGAELILVTTKSMQTTEASAAIARFAPADASVISFQNGVSNAEQLRACVGNRPVLAGMVAFNVAQRTPQHLHCGIGGALAVEAGAIAAHYADLFAAVGLPLQQSEDIAGLQWGKLLLNLNNALNALSGVSLGEQLRQPDFRRCWALLIAEALELLQAADIRPADTLAMPIRLMPEILSVSNSLYGYIISISGRGSARADPHARSSMANDFSRGRATEIDYLQGEVVRLAQRLGRSAPVNQCVIDLVKAVEQDRSKSFQPMAGSDLYRMLSAARQGHGLN